MSLIPTFFIKQLLNTTCMKHSRLLFILMLSCTMVPLTSQEEQQEERYPGVVSGRIYSNFNYRVNYPEHATSFALTRAYFGYDRQISEQFHATVKLDVGSPEDISEFSRINRYAYFKNAGVTYRNGAVTAWGGLFDMVQYKVQEDFWGYRYLYKSYMDEYRFGPSADLGAGVRYHFNRKFEADFVISNGEGYSSPQLDDDYKAGWGVTFRPIENLTIRGYYSIFLVEIPQMTFSGFAGYSMKNFRIAGEYNHQLNYRFNLNRDRYGYSIYSTYKLSDNWEIFVRYDQLFSNPVGDNNIPWNLPEDGSALIGGVQFKPVRNIHITMDYQDWVEYAGNGDKEQIIYLHLEARF
jgi:hypothetical protein